MGDRNDDSLAPGTHGERAGVRGLPRDETQPSAESSTSETPIRARQLRAPYGDGEVLIESRDQRISALLWQNQNLLFNSPFANCGCLLELAQNARQEVVEAAQAYSRSRYGRLI